MSPLLDEKLDLSFLLGTGSLAEVCFGRYTVILRFDKISIAIQGACEVTTAEGRLHVCDPELNPGELTMFTTLFESEIKSYRITPRPELILIFSNGCQLSLIDHQDGYESFVIYLEDGSVLAV
jgi:hypothetical protein